jgi:hypothetical protein
MGRPRVERLQRGTSVLGRLSAAGPVRGGPGRVGAGRSAVPRAARGGGVRARALPLSVRVARTRASVARRTLRGAPARALASARAAARRAGGLCVLHGRRVGLRLLPPSHRRAVDERSALLAPGAHELGSHQRERARADTEAADRAERGDSAGGGAGRRIERPRGRRCRDRCGPRRIGRARVRQAAAALPGTSRRRGQASACPRGARCLSACARGAGLCDSRGRLQQGAAMAGRGSGHGPASPRGHGVPRRGAGLSGAHGRVLLVDAHRRDPRRARHALELRPPARGEVRVSLRRARAPGASRPACRDRPSAGPVRRRGGSFGDVGATDR